MTQRAIEVVTMGNCPGCGREIGHTIGHTPSGADEPAVFHTAPPCDDFLARDPLEFLRWVREYRSNLA